ncbi:MAG: hypothetical protein GY754_11935 [bacterium]|nr:hypothetical protein [bacterium]
MNIPKDTIPHIDIILFMAQVTKREDIFIPAGSSSIDSILYRALSEKESTR